jgi:hypothetical protein
MRHRKFPVRGIEERAITAPAKEHEMSKDRDLGSIKRPYEKPELRVVELAAEEVLAAGCKTSFSGTAVGAVPCTAGSCAGEGS